jgi:flagellar hook-basal body complex protein FliE
MPGPILPISSPALANPLRPAARTGGGEFGDVLASAIRSVENVGQNASTSVDQFLKGEGEDVHSTVLAITRAEMAFDMFLETRNKAVSAYQEIMRMQM